MQACKREGDLDGITWREVKTMKPGSGTTGEYPTVWETPGGGGEPDQWQIGDFAHRIETAAKAPPAGCTEVIPGEPVAPSLREVERPAGELDWNPRSSRHGPRSCGRRVGKKTAPVKFDYFRKRGLSEEAEGPLSASCRAEVPQRQLSRHWL